MGQIDYVVCEYVHVGFDSLKHSCVAGIQVSSCERFFFLFIFPLILYVKEMKK